MLKKGVHDNLNSDRLNSDKILKNSNLDKSNSDNSKFDNSNSNNSNSAIEFLNKIIKIYIYVCSKQFKKNYDFYQMLLFRFKILKFIWNNF